MSAMPQPPPEEWPDLLTPPPGVRRSMEAYWRDLPALLKSRYRGQWVAYQGDERLGFARTKGELYQECYRRGLRDSKFWIDRVEPDYQPPWVPIQVEGRLGEFEEDTELPAEEVP